VTLELPDGSLCSVPVGWTDFLPPDSYLSIGGGRSRFRVEDLLIVADLIAAIGGKSVT
jgi:hypothetical protein